MTAWRSTIYAILPHETEALVWLQETAQGYALPARIMVGGTWETGAAEAERPLRQQLGDLVHILYRVHFQKDDVAQTTESIYVLENLGVKMADGRWVRRHELNELTLFRPEHRAVIETCLNEWETGQIPALRPSWAKAGWHNEAATWIENQLAQHRLALTGPLEPVKKWSLSCVLRAPTKEGSFYFKAVAPQPLLVNEAAMVTKLGQLYPQNMPTLLAVDQSRDWMLLPEFAQIVGWGAPLAQRKAFLSQFGQLQVTAVQHLDELLAAGCLDRRLDWLVEQIEPLLMAEMVQTAVTDVERNQLLARIPHLRELCRELAGYAIPETLVHGDLHGDNVAVRGDEFLFFDWTDACIAHPFFDMVDIFTERDTAVQTQLRDAYLAQWTAFEPMPRLLAVWSLAEIIGALNQAVSYWQLMENIEPHGYYQLDWGVPYWLRKVLMLIEKREASDGG